MKHTPEPWKVITRERTSKPDRFGRTTTGQEIFINGGDGLGSVAKMYVGHQADARRIVACVNALKGMPTELLETHGVNAAAANEHRTRLLVGALEMCVKAMDPPAFSHHEVALEHARSALGKLSL